MAEGGTRFAGVIMKPRFCILQGFVGMMTAKDFFSLDTQQGECELFRRVDSTFVLALAILLCWDANAE